MIDSPRDLRHPASKLYGQGGTLEAHPRQVFEALLAQRGLSLDAAGELLHWGNLKLKTIRSQSKDFPVTLSRNEWRVLGL
jgi:hypothetical protein